jgi:hypothetical protein
VEHYSISIDDQNNVRKIKHDLKIYDRREARRKGPLPHDSPGMKFDFSKFDRLTVYRKLQTFEITTDIISIVGMKSVS